MRIDEAARFVPASPDRVLDAFRDADLLAEWLPPADMDGRIEAADLRAGGSFRTMLVYRDASQSPGKTRPDADVSDTRIAVLEPGRVVWEVEFDSADPHAAGTMTMTWAIEPQASGALVTVRATDVPEVIAPADHVAGLTASLENLAELLAGE